MILTCKSESAEVDEYKIHNENGRVVITPMPEKKTDAVSHVPIRNRAATSSSSTVQLRDRTASSSNSSSAEDGFSSEGKTNVLRVIAILIIFRVSTATFQFN